MRVCENFFLFSGKGFLAFDYIPKPRPYVFDSIVLKTYLIFSRSETVEYSLCLRKICCIHCFFFFQSLSNLKIDRTHCAKLFRGSFILYFCQSFGSFIYELVRRKDNWQRERASSKKKHVKQKTLSGLCKSVRQEYASKKLVETDERARPRNKIIKLVRIRVSSIHSFDGLKQTV